MSNLKVGDLRMEFYKGNIVIHKIIEIEPPNGDDGCVYTHIQDVDGNIFLDLNQLPHFINITKPLNKFFKRLYNVKEMFND